MTYKSISPFARNFATLSAALGLSSLSLGGTFTILGVGCTATLGTNTISNVSLSGSAVDSYSAEGYMHANDHLFFRTASQKTCGAGASFVYSFTIEYVPSYPGDVPGVSSYTCTLQARQRTGCAACAGSSTMTTGLTTTATADATQWDSSSSVYAASTGWYDASTFSNVNSPGPGAWNIVGNTDFLNAASGASSSWVTCNDKLSGVVFSLQSGHWVGTAVYNDWSPQINFFLDLGDPSHDDAQTEAFMQRQLRIVDIAGQTITTRW